MSPEKDAYLCEKYPEIFGVNRNSDVKESCMSWGFEISDGWFHIIDMACSLAQNHIKWKNEQRERSIQYNLAAEKAKAGDPTDLYKVLRITNPDDMTRGQREDVEEALGGAGQKVPDPVPLMVAEQIKEKFGTLRFYYHGGDDYVNGVVRMAEAMSGVTCEVCGNPGKTTYKGWIKTACEEHSRE